MNCIYIRSKYNFPKGFVSFIGVNLLSEGKKKLGFHHLITPDKIRNVDEEDVSDRTDSTIAWLRWMLVLTVSTHYSTHTSTHITTHISTHISTQVLPLF